MGKVKALASDLNEMVGEQQESLEKLESDLWDSTIDSSEAKKELKKTLRKPGCENKIFIFNLAVLAFSLYWLSTV